MSDQNEDKSVADLSRRNFLGVGSTALATAALAGITAHAQEMQDTRKAEKDISVSNPGQENKLLLAENPSSNMPPPTDHGDIGPVWYSFDLVHRRVEEGGWTHEVNSIVLPTSTDLAGVNMRLTAGSFRELHWHTADEWAIMLDGNARVTVMNPDGTMFIDDVNKGDLWLFPAGFPHSIQGLRPNGCEFLLVFDQGDFSEDGTFLLRDYRPHAAEHPGQKFWPRQGNYRENRKKRGALYFPRGSASISRARQGGQWRTTRGISYPIHVQDVDYGSHAENTGRRSSYCGLA